MTYDLLGLLQGLGPREQANLTPSVQQTHGARVSFSSGSSSISSSSSRFEHMSTNLQKRGMTDTQRRQFQHHVKPTTKLRPGDQEFQVGAATNGISARARRRHDANGLHGNPNKAAMEVVEIDGSGDEYEGNSDCFGLGLNFDGGDKYAGYYGDEQMLQWCEGCGLELNPEDPFGSATHMSTCTALSHRSQPLPPFSHSSSSSPPSSSSSSSSYSSLLASASAPALAPRPANGYDAISDQEALDQFTRVKKLVKKELNRRSKLDPNIPKQVSQAASPPSPPHLLARRTSPTDHHASHGPAALTSSMPLACPGHR